MKNYPLKSIANINNQTLGENTNLDREIKYIDISSVSQTGFNGEYQNFTFTEAPSRARRLVNKGSTIIATVRTYLKAVAYFDNPDPKTVVSTGFAVLEPSPKILPKYLYYRVAADDFVQRVEANSVGVSYPAINPSDLGSMSIDVADTIVEQKKIANFLDHKVAGIDIAIAKKKRLLELLEEKRRAQIIRIMTRGLNIKKFKDSGIEWLGKIPENYELTYLMDIALERKEKNYKGLEPQLLSLSYGKIITKDINENGGLLPDSFDTYQLLKKGNIVLRLTDLQNDHVSLRVGFVEEPGMITSAYSSLTAKQKILPRYLYYYLHAIDLSKVFYNMGGGVRQSMKFGDLKRLTVTLPDKETQEDIINYLNSYSKSVDETKIKLHDSTKLLEEYKTSLISNAVTGRMKI